MTTTTEETWAKVKEEAARVKADEEARTSAKKLARAKAKEEAQVKAEQEARAKVEEEIRAKAKQEARAKAEEEARVKTEQEARAKAEEEASAKAEGEIVNFQDLGEARLEPATMATSFRAMGFETIAAEATDYSKKTLENGSAFVEKLLGAKSFESAILIQSEYAKASYADFVVYLTKIGELYSKLAKEAFTRRSHVG